MMHTLNLADLLPMTTAWSGEPFNPSPLLPPQSPPLFQAFTQGRTAFRGNVHVNDLGNFLILGPPGAGKSTLLAFLNAQVCRYPKARVFAFDKGYSLLALCLGVDGHHYDIGEDQNLTLCPLSRIAESKAEQTWAETWIASLCEYQNFGILPHHRQAIHQAMTTLSHAHSKTLTDFVATLQDIELRQVLKHYTLEGAMGALLDGDSDNVEMKRFQVFEIGTLMELGDKNALPVLEYLFHRIETTLDGSLAMLSIDEAWMALQHPVFREKIREWLKVFRKANVSVGLATQSISDAASSGILDVLMEACPTKIFLANPSATTEASSKFYRQLGLSDKQIAIIAHLVPKRDYYFTQPTGKRVINLGLGPQSLCWLGVSSKDDVRALKTLKSTNSDWRQKWVASR
jgi:type IV secretion system protein VirB4